MAAAFVFVLLFGAGVWIVTAWRWYAIEVVASARMSVRHRAWRAATWLPYWIAGRFEWRRPC